MRYFEKQKPIVILILFSVCYLFPAAALDAESRLQYQNRGNRFEGVKPKPVSGYDIELVSAMVDYQEEITEIPVYLKLKFFLEKSEKVYLTVRELDYKHYYWMDKVKFSRPPHAGFENNFEWSTEEVLQELHGLEMYDLGVVARISKPVPSRIEKVAPVIYYHTSFPYKIYGYLFTFKTSLDARIICKVYSQNSATPIYTQTFRRQRGGRPFTFRWKSKDTPRGHIRLALNGYFLCTNEQIDQTIYFYHQPFVE